MEDDASNGPLPEINVSMTDSFNADDYSKLEESEKSGLSTDQSKVTPV